MATPKECRYYNKCGFVQYRKDRPWPETPELPADGDCGVRLDSCQRANPLIEPIDIKNPLPATDTEIKIAYPVQYTSDSGRERRI